MRHIIAALAMAAVACGGGDPPGEEATTGGDASTETATEGGTGTVHEVRMVITDQGEYSYIPDALTIKVGDTVRWLNESGFPHNVAFYPDQIPGGAADVLNATMADRIGDLSGPLLTTAGQFYEITFAGAPAGEYGYFCTPHVILGMIATLTIEP